MLEKLIFIILAVDLVLLLSVIAHDLIMWVKKKRSERSKRRKMYEEALIEDFAKRLQVTKECAHGKWLKDDSDGCCCSNCEWYADHDYDFVTNHGWGSDDFIYCPHCGAKMDGGNNNA